MNVLITGGAGFIGGHLADALIGRGYNVRALDNLEPQVHPKGVPPPYLNKKVEFVRGDVRNINDVAKTLEGVEAVFHFAAQVGVGQSQYQPVRYVETNLMGTANLIQAIIEKKGKVSRLIVAGSMSIYGEGAGKCVEHGIVRPMDRAADDLAKGVWETRCPICGNFTIPAPISENAIPRPAGIYAVTKLSQEQMVLAAGAAHGFVATSLRFFNVYGPRQSLSNPYTGVAAIFISRLKNGKAPMIFEDGAQSRDFIHVRDIAGACVKVLEKREKAFGIFNVGTGKPTTVKKMATVLAGRMGLDVEPEIMGRYRSGDIRHCVADVSKAADVLDFRSQTDWADGIADLIEWSKTEASEDMCESAQKELITRNLAPKTKR